MLVFSTLLFSLCSAGNELSAKENFNSELFLSKAESLSTSVNSFQLAKATFLPDTKDDLGFSGRDAASSGYGQGDVCKDYPLSQCPANGTCSSCVTNFNRKKLTGCKSGYKISGNACVPSTCATLNSGYAASMPSNSVCIKVSQYGLTCYSNCRNISCGSYPVNCPAEMTGDSYTANGITYQSCPDCPASTSSSSTTVYSCTTRKCKITSCPSTQKLNSAGTACINKDDTCPTNYYKSCETGTQGDPKYTELGTACYQCKPKEPETCKAYVEDVFKNSNYTFIGSMSDLQHALIDNKNNFVIVNDFTLTADIDLSGKTMMGAAEIAAASPLCAKKQKITTTHQITTNNSTEFKKLIFANKLDENSSFDYNSQKDRPAMITGGGTMRDIELVYNPRQTSVGSDGTKYYSSNYYFPHLKAKGTLNLYNIKSTGMRNLYTTGTSTLNIKGYVDIVYDATDGSGEAIALSGTPTINIESGGTLSYKGPGAFMESDSLTNERLNSFTIKINGSTNYQPSRTYGNYIYVFSKGTIDINSPQTIKGSVRVPEGSTLNINAKTIFEAINPGSTEQAINSEYRSYININAPVYFNNFKAITDPTYWLGGDGVLGGGYIYINSDFITNTRTGFGQYTWIDTVTFGPKANVRGLARMRLDYDYADATFTISTGAKLEIGGVCKRATSSRTLKGEKKNILDFTSPPNPPFSGGC